MPTRRNFIASSAAALLAQTPAKKPNVILMVADDLGYGDLGCYGQPRIKTPNIDKLANEGVRFTQAYAGSTVCGPSRCSLVHGAALGAFADARQHRHLAAAAGLHDEPDVQGRRLQDEPVRQVEPGRDRDRRASEQEGLRRVLRLLLPDAGASLLPADAAAQPEGSEPAGQLGHQPEAVCARRDHGPGDAIG